MKARSAAAMIAGLTGLAPAPALAYPDGAPAGHSGGFGEPTCGECHFGGDPPEPGGLRLSGLSEAFAPGASYELELKLYLSGMVIGGFQLTARLADGPGRGRSAGRLVGGEGTEMELTEGVAYLGHSEAVRAEGEAIGWRIRWIAPDEARTVVFNAAAVAGNDDHSPVGDTVHELELRLQPQ